MHGTASPTAREGTKLSCSESRINYADCVKSARVNIIACRKRESAIALERNLGGRRRRRRRPSVPPLPSLPGACLPVLGSPSPSLLLLFLLLLCLSRLAAIDLGTFARVIDRRTPGRRRRRRRRRDQRLIMRQSVVHPQTTKRTLTALSRQTRTPCSRADLQLTMSWHSYLQIN